MLIWGFLGRLSYVGKHTIMKADSISVTWNLSGLHGLIWGNNNLFITIMNLRRSANGQIQASVLQHVTCMTGVSDGESWKK